MAGIEIGKMDRLDFMLLERCLVDGGGQEFQQVDFANQPFTAVGVGGEHVGAFQVKFFQLLHSLFV